MNLFHGSSNDRDSNIRCDHWHARYIGMTALAFAAIGIPWRFVAIICLEKSRLPDLLLLTFIDIPWLIGLLIGAIAIILLRKAPARHRLPAVIGVFLASVGLVLPWL